MLADTADQAKWADPEYRKQAAAQGRTKKSIEDQDKKKMWHCNLCGSYKVWGTHHCSKCKRCVYKMDHHCPWTDNCVGYLTVKPFLLFLVYVIALCVWALSAMMYIAVKRDLGHINIVSWIADLMPHKHMANYAINNIIKYDNTTLSATVGSDEEKI